jgi:hypothetical protein
VTGEFSIAAHPNLKNLDGLNLKNVGTNLKVNKNAALEDISSLFGVETLGGELMITDNPELATCRAEELKTHLETKGEWTEPKTSTISGNNDEKTCE